jgi:hypothetical protein
MLKPITLQGAVLAIVSGAWAAVPLGSVSSAELFDLKRSTVPPAGAPAWPVAGGDLIANHSAPATIEFRNGSRVILAENSQARIEAKP